MDLGLRGQTVLITGGAGGIGSALTKAFAAEGAKVAITYHNDKAGAQQLASELQANGQEVIALSYDMADLGQAKTVTDAVIGKWGRLDALVANAVSWPMLPQRQFSEVDIKAWAQAVNTNLHGTAALLQQAAKQMLAQKYGRIVVISTEIAKDGMPGSTAYSTPKAGIHGLIASLRWELGPHNVLVNMVSPGFNMTPRNLQRIPEEIRQQVIARTPTGRLSTPEDAAPTVLYMASKANSNITGEFVSVSGGADRT